MPAQAGWALKGMLSCSFRQNKSVIAVENVTKQAAVLLFSKGDPDDRSLLSMCCLCSPVTDCCLTQVDSAQTPPLQLAAPLDTAQQQGLVPQQTLQAKLHICHRAGQGQAAVLSGDQDGHARRKLLLLQGQPLTRALV